MILMDPSRSTGFVEGRAGSHRPFNTRASTVFAAGRNANRLRKIVFKALSAIELKKFRSPPTA
jgi:hypothetical protein